MSQKLRVLHLINDLRTDGGAEVALVHLIEQLDRSKLDVWVAGLFRLGPAADKLSIPPDRILSFGFRTRALVDIKGILRLTRFLRKQRIELIHTHLFDSSAVGRIAALLAGVRCRVVTEHNVYPNQPRWIMVLNRILAGWTDRIIAVSEAVREDVSQKTKIESRRLVTIPVGVPVTQIPHVDSGSCSETRNQLKIPPEANAVLTVASLSKQKSLDRLVSAARRVVKYCPDTVFLLAGTGPEQSRLQAMINQLELHQAVRLLGRRDDIYTLMQCSDAFVLSSDWEGLPVALIEAASCQLPLVATDVGGCSEIVRDGETGFLVPKRDEEALVNALVKTLQMSSAERRHMGQVARELALSRFDVSHCSRAIAQLYTEVYQDAGL